MLRTFLKISPTTGIEPLTAVERKQYLQKVDILECLYFQGEKSNSEICSTLSISSPTSLRLLNQLIDDGLIKKEGYGISIGGRKPDLYRLEEDIFYVLSIQVDQTKVQMVLYDNHNRKVRAAEEIHYRIEKELNNIDHLFQVAHTMIVESEIDSEKLIGIGVSMPGLVSSREGKNFTYFLTGQESDSLQEILKNKFQKPVYILNDAKSACIAEKHFGLADDRKNVLVISMDWGIGLGIILDGKMIEGASGFAGEFGHIPLVEGGKLCHCGKRGCLETVASGMALTEMARKGLKQGEHSVLSQNFRKNPELLNPKNIIEAANKGDQFAIKILSEVGINLGKGIAILIQIFNPELIIIEGKFAAADQFITTPIQQSVNTYCMAQLREKTEIALSNLGEDSVLLGSVAAVMEKVFEKHFRSSESLPQIQRN